MDREVWSQQPIARGGEGRGRLLVVVCLLVALLLRRQSSAVAAIEGRDGVEFWFDKSSPFGPPKLLRLPGLRRVEPA